MRNGRKALLLAAAALAVLWATVSVFVRSAPVVVLHYAANASAPVGYFYNDNNQITKSTLAPGESIDFRTPHRPPADYFVEVSLPADSRDGVELKQPFSRVDVYIGADTKIERTVIRTDYMARIGGK